MSQNPVRNYAIEWLIAQAQAQADSAAAAAIAGILTTPGDATGSVYGDVVGALLGPLKVAAIHGDEITPPAFAADADNFAPAGSDALIWRLDLAGFALDGIAAPDSPGEVHLLVALTAGAIAHEQSSSTDVNRILCPGAVDLAVPVDGLVLVVYDGTANRWRVMGGGGGGSIAADEDGSAVVASATAFDFRHGLDVTASGTTAQVAVNESELTFAAPTASAPGDASATGAAASLANSGHKHQRESWGAVGDIVAETFGASAAAGASGKTADAAHRHAMSSETAETLPVTIIDAKGDLIAGTAADTAARVAVGTDGYALIARSGATPGVAWEAQDVGIEVVIGDGVTAMATGSKGYIEVPFACAIRAARLVADVSGSVVVDAKKATYSGLPTTASICASAKATLSSAQKSQDSTLTGWTTTIAAGDWLEFNVDSVATIRRVTLSLTVRRT